jgi:hypothetical protein
MQVETLLVVQVGGVDGAKHSAFGGQVDPPVHSGMVSVWQIIVAPQSASVVQGASTQVPLGCGGRSGAGVGAGSVTGQMLPGAHAGAVFAVAGSVITITQVNPLPQSAAVVHPCARAAGATARRAVNAPIEKRTFLSDMGDLRA